MLSEELKSLKDKSNMTAQQIADKSGIPLSTVTRILSGRTQDPTFSVVSAIVAALHGSLDALVGIDPPDAPPSDERLIRLYKEVISAKDKWLKRLAGALGVAVVMILSILLIFGLKHA